MTRSRGLLAGVLWINTKNVNIFPSAKGVETRISLIKGFVCLDFGAVGYWGILILGLFFLSFWFLGSSGGYFGWTLGNNQQWNYKRLVLIYHRRFKVFLGSNKNNVLVWFFALRLCLGFLWGTRSCHNTSRYIIDGCLMVWSFWHEWFGLVWCLLQHCILHTWFKLAFWFRKIGCFMEVLIFPCAAPSFAGIRL